MSYRQVEIYLAITPRCTSNRKSNYFENLMVVSMNHFCLTFSIYKLHVSFILEIAFVKRINIYALIELFVYYTIGQVVCFTFLYKNSIKIET